MAVGGGSVAGNWNTGGAQRATGRGSRGFSGTRGFGRPPRTASGRPSSFRAQSFRGEGEENLYSMLGRPVGGGLSPYSAGMGGGQYTPPGTGVGTGYQGYGSGWSGFSTTPPSGAGDVGQQGSGTDFPGPAGIGQKGVGTPPGFGMGESQHPYIPPSIGDIQPTGQPKDVFPGGGNEWTPDPGVGGPGESGLGEQYEGGPGMDPRELGAVPGRAWYDPTYDPVVGEPWEATKPKGYYSRAAIPGTHVPGEGAYDPTGESDWVDIMGNPFAGELGPQDQYESPTTMAPWSGQFGQQQPMQQPVRRQGRYCPPGDPNCR